MAADREAKASEWLESSLLTDNPDAEAIVPPTESMHLSDTSPIKASQNEAHGLPERIGKYAIKRYLGGGGFGMVFEAEDEAMGITVALKVPRLLSTGGGRGRPELLHTPASSESRGALGF